MMEQQLTKGLEYLNLAAGELCEEMSDAHAKEQQREKVTLQLALANAYLLASIARDLDALRRRMAP